ncbi:MAG: dTDP-4-dehydrorhamnose 3,5-epimerase [Rhodomicrobium sp.]
MNFVDTDIPGVMLIEPVIFEDSRGYFMELFRANVISARGPRTTYVQQSESKSRYGVIRGLHYQLPPHAQTKIVRVVSGKVIDVAVDIRKDSPTFGRHVSVELSSDNKHLLLIPRGFAHGFAVLSETATINYMVDNYYAPASERGIIHSDPALAIDWKLPLREADFSKKDGEYPLLEHAEVFETGANLYD